MRGEIIDVQSKPESAKDWQQLAVEKLASAEALTRQGHRKLAYDQFGYAVECAIKSMIMRKTGLNRWPDRDNRPELYTHSLNSLMKQTGLFQRFCNDRQKNSNLRLNWLVVKDWTPSRYDLKEPSHKLLQDFRRATAHSEDGIISWLNRQ
jgi:HEPN domain-containing protein